MKVFGQTIKYIFIILCMITIVWSIKYIWQQEKWSPIDEYAHMDYIEKMREGMMPKLHYAISHDIYQNLIEQPVRMFTPPVHSREELGMGNYSYQAKHPPLYYAVLIAPNMILKKMGYDAFQRLKVLRLISYLLFAFASFLYIPLFKLLKQKGYLIPEFYSWFCVLFSLLIATHQRYGLTNNMLSPLFINASLLFVFKYQLTTQIKFLYTSILLAGLSICVALTNVFIVPFILLYALIIYWPNFSVKTFFYALAILLIPVIIIVWWKIVTIPDEKFEEYVQNLLFAIIPANALSFKIFIELLLNDSFQLSFISAKIDLSKIYLLFLGINISVCLVFIKTIIKKHIWILYVLGVFTIFIINLYFLNKYVARVHWVALRNYMGFIPIIFISCSSFIVVISGKIKNKIA